MVEVVAAFDRPARITANDQKIQVARGAHVSSGSGTEEDDLLRVGVDEPRQDLGQLSAQPFETPPIVSVSGTHEVHSTTSVDSAQGKVALARVDIRWSWIVNGLKRLMDDRSRRAYVLVSRCRVAAQPRLAPTG
jgi:hypothetical protein